MRLHIQRKIICYTAPPTYLNISGWGWSGYSSKLSLLSSVTDLLEHKCVWLKSQDVEQKMRLHVTVSLRMLGFDSEIDDRPILLLF